MIHEDETEDNAVSRRRLLRRASTVAAGVAGAGVVGAVAISSPAEAAAGGAVTMGSANDAGTTATSITTNDADAATLTLANTAQPASGSSTGKPFAAPSLALTPSVNAWDIDSQNLPIGSIAAVQFDPSIPVDIFVKIDTGLSVVLSNSNNTVSTMPIAPTRALDTRNTAGRANIVDTSVLDSAGRLLAGKWLELDLGNYVSGGIAVYGNLTAVVPLAGGYLSVAPGKQTAKPSTSNINFVTNQVIANSFVSAILSSDKLSDVISIYASSTTHVLVDIFAFGVNDLNSINSGLAPHGGSTVQAQIRKRMRQLAAR